MAGAVLGTTDSVMMRILQTQHCANLRAARGPAPEKDVLQVTLRQQSGIECVIITLNRVEEFLTIGWVGRGITNEKENLT